jgi:4-diphosphocytidyl-2-C-methyl-D-erythritol kinase
MLNLKRMIKIKSPAKINLYLHILSKLENGYHEIDSAFQLIDICDELSFGKSSKGVQIECNLDIEMHENIVYQAAMLLNEISDANHSVKIEINKNIPTGSGLGGGSSNAATALVVLNKIWGIDLDRNELMALGTKLGADVPFFINGSNAYVSGIGEKLVNKSSESTDFLIIYPNTHCSSAEMYKKFDRGTTSNLDKQNSFWDVYKSLNNEINDFVTKYRDDFKLCLSGSGSSMFVVYESHHELDKILKIIPSNWRFFLTKPLQYAPLTMKF